MMILSAIRTHFDYTAWASARLVNAAGTLSPEELTKDFGTADHSVLGTLVHVYAADRIWYDRIHGNLLVRFIEPERDMHLRVLQNDWPALLRQWRELAPPQTEESPATNASYKDLKVHPYETPLGQIALHLSDHATHPPGPVATVHDA